MCHGGLLFKSISRFSGARTSSVKAMCAIGDALHDYDSDFVKVRGLQSTIHDHGMSWLQFMFDRLQQIPCKPCPTNDDVDGMDSEGLKELVRAWQEVHDEKMALYAPVPMD